MMNFGLAYRFQEIRIQCRIQIEIPIRRSGLPRCQICCSHCGAQCIPCIPRSGLPRNQKCCSPAVHSTFTSFSCPVSFPLLESRIQSAQQGQRLPPVQSRCIRYLLCRHSAFACAARPSAHLFTGFQSCLLLCAVLAIKECTE
jgi:hypothetical protein